MRAELRRKDDLTVRISDAQSQERSNHDWLLRVTFLALGLVAGVLMGCGLLSATGLPENVPADLRPDFQLIADAWSTIQRVYVDRAAVIPKQPVSSWPAGMSSLKKIPQATSRLFGSERTRWRLRFPWRCW